MSQHPFHESVQGRRPSGPLPLAVSKRLYAEAVSDEAIAKRAYDKFVTRGRADGGDREDWAAATRELIAETFGQ